MRMDREVTGERKRGRCFLALLASKGIKNDKMGDAKDVNRGRGVVQ